MLSPNPLSLFCALLLCLPLALVFTICSDPAATSAAITTTTTTAVTHPRLTLPSSPPPTPPSPPLPPLFEHDDVAFLEWADPNPTRPVKELPVRKLLPPPPSPPAPAVVAGYPNPARPKDELTNEKLLPRPVSKNSTRPEKEPAIEKLLLPPPSSPPPPVVVPEDDKDDVELFKRATRASPDPTGPVKKVAFMFMTTTPLPFAPLWELFFNQSEARGRYNVYIHADPRAEYNPPFSGVFSGRVIPSSKPTRRNTPTLIAAARRLLAHALLDDPDNYMFTLISGACVPLHSFNFTYNTLVDSTRSFIEVLSNESNAYGRWAARGEHVMLPEVSLDVFRIGSQFWSLTRRHARVVVEDVKLWNKFRLPCVNPGACYPEENYFPTLLSMVDPQGVVPATLTNVNWRGRRDGHPHTYNGSEVGPELIRWLRESRPRYGNVGMNGSDLFVSQRWDPFLFARKFAPNCVQPLVRLAKDVIFKD